MIDPSKEAYLATLGLNEAISHLEQAVKDYNAYRESPYRESLHYAYALYNSITNTRIKRH